MAEVIIAKGKTAGKNGKCYKYFVKSEFQNCYVLTAFLELNILRP